MKSKKYYIIKRNSQELSESYLQEFSGELRIKLEKRIKHDLPLLLIEKTCNADYSETYTNLWTVHEGCEINWTKYTKGRLMYDYTGIINPIIHLKDKHYTWESYNESLKKK